MAKRGKGSHNGKSDCGGDVREQRTQFKLLLRPVASVAKKKNPVGAGRRGAFLQCFEGPLTSDSTAALYHSKMGASIHCGGCVDECLAAKLLQAIKPAVEEYGIEIHRIALQEVRLRPEIHQAAVAACTTAYSPLKAQRKAAGKKVLLQAEADVISTKSKE